MTTCIHVCFPEFPCTMLGYFEGKYTLYKKSRMLLQCVHLWHAKYNLDRKWEISIYSNVHGVPPIPLSFYLSMFHPIPPFCPSVCDIRWRISIGFSVHFLLYKRLTTVCSVKREEKNTSLFSFNLKYDRATSKGLSMANLIFPSVPVTGMLWRWKPKKSRAVSVTYQPRTTEDTD